MDGDVVEIKEGHVNNTERKIITNQNWMKLLLSGEFGHKEDF